MINGPPKICTQGPFLIAKNGPWGLIFAMGNGPRVW